MLNSLTASKGRVKARRIGRGGKRGKTSGKGHKGQKSRAGRKIRPAERDIIKRIPKRRGYGKNRSRTVNSSRIRPSIVNMGDLDRVFSDGERVAPKELAAKGLIRAVSGSVPDVKILGKGVLTKKLVVADCTLSAAAHAAVLKAGGTVL